MHGGYFSKKGFGVCWWVCMTVESGVLSGFCGNC